MKKVLKIIGIVLIVILVMGISFWKLAPIRVKGNLIKKLSKQQTVRNIVADEVQDDYEKKVQDTGFKEEEVIVNEEVEHQLTGYKNVVLFGIDASDGSFNSGTQTDTIMIISINNDTGAVRMVSLYRDTFLKIIGKNGKTFYSKVNSAYNNGGAQAALSTLNTNLDLNLSDYIVVNFDGLSEIIDMMGGIDIAISSTEMRRINKISTDMLMGTDIEYTPIEESGDIHLTGLQATAFCRIRDAVFYDEEGNDYHYDFGRTARQRYVMKKLVSKAKSTGISTLISLARQIINMNTENQMFIKTSLNYNEIMDLIPVLVDYNIEGSTGFPFTLMTPYVKGADLLVAQGLSYNVSELHKFMFNETDYKPSVAVSEINDYIIEYTGVPEVHLDEEISSDQDVFDVENTLTDEGAQSEEAMREEMPVDSVESFVSRLYEDFFGRNADASGLASWTNLLKSGKATGAKVVYSFVYSEEFQNNPLSNEAFVTAMYNTIFRRKPDTNELNAWVTVLQNGCTRKKILSGILRSNEMIELCESLGIVAGSYRSDEITDNHVKVTYFVSRMYRYCFNREADYDGLSSWVSALVEGRATGIKIAKGFFLSEEIKGRHLSNSDYITVAYRALLDREPDASGKQAWMDKLAMNNDRKIIIDGFLGSKEFKDLCNQYGIEVGSATPKSQSA